MIRCSICILVICGAGVYLAVDNFLDQFIVLMPTYAIFLVWCFVLSAFLLRILANRIGKQNAQIVHDYNYYLYHRMMQKRRHMGMMVLAESQIKLGNYTLAMHALKLVERQNLSKDAIYWYYLLMAIVSLGLGDWQNCEKYVEYCNATIIESAISIQWTPNLTIDDLMTHLKVRNEQQRKKTTKLLRRMFLGMSYLLLSSFYLTTEAVLPNGLEFRRWFTITGHLLIWLIGIGIFLWILKCIYCFFNEQLESTGKKVFCSFLLILCGCCVVLAALFRGFIGLMQLKDEDDNGDGTLTVVEYNSYNRNTYSLYQKKGPFLREYIGTDYQTAREPSTSVPSTPTTEQVTEEEKEEQKVSSEMMELQMQYLAVYRAIGIDKKYKFAYSAKGEMYLSIEPEQTEGKDTMTAWRIVYDRESKNGLCSEFVYYEDTYEIHNKNEKSISNTAILNFYAVKHSDHTVIAANKTTWGGGGDAEYRDVTGE